MRLEKRSHNVKTFVYASNLEVESINKRALKLYKERENEANLRRLWNHVITSDLEARDLEGELAKSREVLRRETI